MHPANGPVTLFVLACWGAAALAMPPLLSGGCPLGQSGASLHAMLDHITWIHETPALRAALPLSQTPVAGGWS